MNCYYDRDPMQLWIVSFPQIFRQESSYVYYLKKKRRKMDKYELLQEISQVEWAKKTVSPYTKSDIFPTMV